jgi:hypothetical protein
MRFLDRAVELRKIALREAAEQRQRLAERNPPARRDHSVHRRRRDQNCCCCFEALQITLHDTRA